MVGRAASALALVLIAAGAAPAQQPTHLKGEVFGPDGAPVSAARIWAMYSTAAREPRVAVTTTNDRGRFFVTLPAGDPSAAVSLIAHKAGLAMDALTVWPEPGEVLLAQLGAEPERRSGVVTDCRGRPIRGATLTAYLPGWPRTAPVSGRDPSPLSTVTDQNGRYVLRDLPPVYFLTLAIRAAGFAPREVYHFQGQNSKPKPVVLWRASQISGRVLRDGKPAAGVRVVINSGTPAAITDASGRYTLSGLRVGVYAIQAYPTGPWTAPTGNQIRVANAQHVAMPDIALVHGGLIRGRVTREGTGEPLAGVQVYAHRDYCYFFVDTVAAKDGTYELRVPPGLVSVSASGLASDDEKKVQVAEGQTVGRVDLELPRPVRMWKEGRTARPADLALTVKVVGGDTITAYEPVVAQVDITNKSADTVVVEDACNRTIRLQVRDPRGWLVAITPRPDFDDGGPSMGHPLKPGETWSRREVFSALYAFAESGEYTIRVQQLQFEPYFPWLAEGSATLKVEPFDAARLRARCDQLLAQAQLDCGELCSIRHDLVIPYLEKLVETGRYGYACHALRRLGTPAAMAVLERLSARTDEVGKAARTAAKSSPQADYWDIELR